VHSVVNGKGRERWCSMPLEHLREVDSAQRGGGGGATLVFIYLLKVASTIVQLSRGQPVFPQITCM